MNILKLENVCKSFSGVEVLKGISFSMSKGEVVSIIGASGSGKSTLLRCITFLERMDKGSMEIAGEPVVTQNVEGASVYPPNNVLRANALKLGIVFQEFNLFPHLSVMQNLTLAPNLDAKHMTDGNRELSRKQALEQKKAAYSANEKQAETLLARVGLGDKKQFYPFQLSGGQKQRAAIARALMLNPEILCFDEPTSALDPELTGEVLKVIKDLKADASTMIVVTHEMNFARYVSDKIIFMAEGRVEEEGGSEDIFTKPKSPKTAAFLNKSLSDFHK